MPRKKVDLKKKTIMDTPSTIENGWLGLNISSGLSYGNITEDKRSDFVFPKSIATFQYMAQDPVIAAANNIINIMINKVKWYFEVDDNATGREKAARDFLNWCMNNMDGMTWKSFINEVGSYRIYGFHIAEKVWKQVNDGKYSGKFKWSILPTRSQSTVQGWVFDEKVRRLKAIKQNLTGLSYRSIETGSDGLIDLPLGKVLLFSYQGTKGNPEGHSPLKDCYQPWTYKKTIESYEAVGVSKDLGGVPVMGIDATWLAKAQSNPNSSEAATLTTLQTYCENLHSGDQTYMIMPVAYNDSGKPLFDFKLIGVDGGGKQYNTRDIINGKQLEILMIYLADVLTLGNTSHGSFALAENKNSLLTFGIENHLSFIKDTIQTQLIPETLIYNGWGDIPKEKMPRLTHSDLDQQNIDELGKLIQRLAAVNFLPRTKESVNEVLDKAGFKFKLQDGDIKEDKKSSSNVLNDDLFTTNENKVGEGMKEGLPSGTGKSNKNNSDINMDNAS